MTPSISLPELAYLIANLRLQRDLTARSLARKLGVPHNTLSRVEKGERKVTLEFAATITKKLSRWKLDAYQEQLLTIAKGKLNETANN